MDDQTRVPAFNVHRVLLTGLIPLARYYNCIYCDHDLSDWVMKQSPTEPSFCPNCEAWTLVGIACLLVVFAAVVGVIWVLSSPQPLIRFR